MTPRRRLVALGAVPLGLATMALVVIVRGGQDGEVVPPPPPTAQAPAETPPPAPDIRTRPDAEQLAAAFQAAFGAGGHAARTVDEDELIYRPGALRWIGDRALLVSPGTNRQDCHACAGTLAIHYLDVRNGAFVMRGEWLTGGGFDDWGRPPDWRFSTELSDRPMLRTESGGGGQGIFCYSMAFYEFSPNGPRQVVDLKTGFTDRGFRVPELHDPPTEVEGDIRNIVSGRSFDMVYTVRHFVERGDDFVEAGSERVTERYVLRGGRYVPRSGESRVPTC